MVARQIAMVSVQQRGFAKKKKSKKTEDEPSEYEDEPAAEETVYEPEPAYEPETAPVQEEKPDFSAATASQPK